MPMPTGKSQILMDCERIKTPKTDCLLKFYQDQELFQFGFQVC